MNEEGLPECCDADEVPVFDGVVDPSPSTLDILIHSLQSKTFKEFACKEGYKLQPSCSPTNTTSVMTKQTGSSAH